MTKQLNQTTKQTAVKRPGGMVIDLLELDRQALVALKAEITREVADMKLYLAQLRLEHSKSKKKLNRAKRNKEETEVIKLLETRVAELDRKRVVTAKAYNFRTADVRAIDVLLAEMKGEIETAVQEKRQTIERYFLDLSRKCLPESLFKSILEQAKAIAEV
jgi:hypothetical protein